MRGMSTRIRTGNLGRRRIRLPGTPEPLAVLAGATWWIDATDATAGDQAIANRGTGGAALNAQVGSTTGVDTNDPKFLGRAAGDPAYMYLPGVASNYMSVPDAAALDIVGDLDVRVRVALDDWTPAANQDLVTKWRANAAGNSWYLSAKTDGKLLFSWNEATGTNRAASSTEAPTVADGAALWLRATLDVDNGAGTPQYEVTFWIAADSATVPTSWTQLGTTVTGTTGASSVKSGDSALFIGTERGDVQNAAGKFHRAQVWNGIEESGGTTVLDVDCSVLTSGAATSFTAATGQTVTIARGTAAGRKSRAVVVPEWSLGADDFFEIASNALINFAETDSFTLLVAHRTWANFGTDDALLAKKADTTQTTAGWALTAGSSTAAQAQLQAGDGTAGATAVSGSRTSGALSVVFGVRDVAADAISVTLNGTTGTPVTDATTASLANAEVMRVGRLSGAGTEYSDLGLHVAALWRRALTAAERAAITTYIQARCP